MDEKAIIEQIADLIAGKFVFPETGEKIAGHLRERIAKDDSYRGLSPAEFAEWVTRELDAIAHDSHLRLDYDPGQAAGGGDTEALKKRHFESARRNNFGFLKVERLAGNIGYLVLREFAPPEVAGDVAAAAMAFMVNTKALIFDIRGNGGGTPEMVQLLISYLVGEEPQPLTGIYSRATDQTEIYETLAEIPGKRMPDVPVYVVVDGETHSAAEAFAYDLQALKRATIVGEHTRGGAHLVDFIPINEMYVLMLPIARAVNLITGGNWQGTGVIPDIKVTDQDPLLVAHRQLLNELLQSAESDEEREFPKTELEALESH